VTPFSILDSLLSVERMKADISNMVRRWIMAGTNASGYLADDCQLVAEARVRQLRSANTRWQLDVQQFWRPFAAAGAQV